MLICTDNRFSLSCWYDKSLTSHCVYKMYAFIIPFHPTILDLHRYLRRKLFPIAVEQGRNGGGWHKTVWSFEMPIIATFLTGIVFKTQCYYKFARHILRKHIMDFWYFEDDYHVSQHAFEAAQPEECCSTVSAKWIEINATKMQKRRPMSEIPGGLTIFICVEASMLAALMKNRKMFQLCMFADFIWRNDPETVWNHIFERRCL